MKTSLKLVFTLVAVSLLIWACSSSDDVEQLMDDDVSINDDVDSTDDESSETLQLIEIDIRVALPEESNLDLSTTEIVSFLQSYDVGSNGQATILANSEEQTFISLQNNEGHVLLYGFIDQTNNTLSIESSAKASLYFALGTFLQFDGIKDKFFNEFETNSEVLELQTAMKTRFLEDPYFMEEEGFAELVKTTVDKLVNNKEIIDVGKGVIVDSQEKSGIRVVNKGRDAIAFQSRTRRRSHAFIYKRKHLDKDALFFEEDIENVTIGSATKEAEIETTNGFTSTLGTVWDWSTGKGLELFIKDSPPVSLPLEANEEEAYYDVRMVGAYDTDDITYPGKFNLSELNKIEDLNFDTALFDVILPVFGTLISSPNIDSKKVQLLQTAMSSLLGSSTVEQIKKGEIKEGSLSFFKQLSLNIASGLSDESFFKNLIDVLELIMNPNYFDDWDKLDAKQIQKVFGPLKIVDAILQANDALARILPDVLSANPLEEWQVVISESNDLTCLVEKSVINPSETTIVEAVVQDLSLEEDQLVRYVWETSGTYGKLVDPNNPNNTGVEYTVTTREENKISFMATVNESELVLGDVKQDIKVKAFLIEGNLQTELGECTTTITITPNKWKIRPDGITISGGNNLVLRIVDEENKPLIAPEGMITDVEWGSTEKHGQFDWYESFSGSTEVTYECLDEETDKGTEIITARVYLKNKDDGSRVLAQELEATVNIDNDENKLIYIVNRQIGGSPPAIEGDWWGYGVWAFWEFDPQLAKAKLPEGKEVERYHLRIIGPWCGNTSRTWLEENQESDLNPETKTYTLVCGSASSGGHRDTWEGNQAAIQLDYAELFARYERSVKDYAQVTVYLRDKQ